MFNQYRRTLKMKIIPLLQSDQYEVLEFLRSHYYKEDPLVIGFEPFEQDQYEEEFDLGCLPYFMSFGAYSENRLVGVILSSSKDEHEADHIKSDIGKLGDAKWATQLKLLYEVEVSANTLALFKLEQSAHVHTLSVHKEYRGKGISAQLITKSIERFQYQGFSLLTIDCTSFYSSKVCEKLGMVLINAYPYSRFCDAFGNQIIKPPKIHDAIRSYAKII